MIIKFKKPKSEDDILADEQMVIYMDQCKSEGLTAHEAMKRLYDMAKERYDKELRK